MGRLAQGKSENKDQDFEGAYEQLVQTSFQERSHDTTRMILNVVSEYQGEYLTEYNRKLLGRGRLFGIVLSSKNYQSIH